MTTLHLVRHGETVWHADNRYAGRTDVTLTPRGQHQAELLGRWAAGAGLAAVASSDLGRAVATAEPAARAAGLTLDVEPDLREVDFGRGEGMTRTEMQAAFPAALDAFRRRPATSPLPEGEAGVAAIARARPVLDQLAAAHEDGAVLVVMHSTLLRLLICSYVGIDPDDYRRVFPRIDNVALNTVRLVDGQASILGLNHPLS